MSVACVFRSKAQRRPATKFDAARGASASKCTKCSTLQEHQTNSHPKLTKHDVLLSTIRDCKNRADSRDRERERERERGERRAEQRRGEERRQNRKKGEQLGRCRPGKASIISAGAPSQRPNCRQKQRHADNRKRQHVPRKRLAKATGPVRLPADRSIAHVSPNCNREATTQRPRVA